jgi:hypothetical protein
MMAVPAALAGQRIHIAAGAGDLEWRLAFGETAERHLQSQHPGAGLVFTRTFGVVWIAGGINWRLFV